MSAIDSERSSASRPSVGGLPACLERHASGLWVRPDTYDASIVAESLGYLAVDPGPGDVLLDVGANIGAVAVAFLAAGVSRVVAIEPEPENFALLRLNTSSYGHRVVSLNLAVAQRAEPRQLWLDEGGNGGMHSIVVRRSSVSRHVACQTLSHLIDSYQPTCLKLDIEGAEYELLGSLATLPRHVRSVALELHFERPEWRTTGARALVGSLEDQGFAALRPPDMRSPVGTIGLWRR